MPESPFPGVQVRHRGGDYSVLDNGAQVLTWTLRDQLPTLWVSPLARFEPGTAVRGGVPVVFPWFGAGPGGDRRPAHGFARTSAWQRVGLTDDVATTGRLEVGYRLDSAGFDMAPFVADLLAEFTADHLRVSLSVTNTGTGDFAYEEALHTYLAVSHVTRISLDGLDGCSYVDKVAGGGEPPQLQAGPVTFAGETDRLYDHAGEVLVNDPDWGRSIRVAKTGSATTVVWNPGPARGAALADVGQYWPDFVCVEAANAGAAAVTVPAGETHILTQTLELV